MSLKPELLELLRCPSCDSRPKLEYKKEQQQLSCSECQTQYPLQACERNPELLIPVLLRDPSIVIGDKA